MANANSLLRERRRSQIIITLTGITIIVKLEYGAGHKQIACIVDEGLFQAIEKARHTEAGEVPRSTFLYNTLKKWHDTR